MVSLFVFILISLLTISGVLFFNKGEKAQEIKSILKKIYENLKDIFLNFKKLFLILKNLFQSPTNKQVNESEGDSTKEENPSSSIESEIISNNDLDTSSDVDSFNFEKNEENDKKD